MSKKMPTPFPVGSQSDQGHRTGSPQIWIGGTIDSEGDEVRAPAVWQLSQNVCPGVLCVDPDIRVEVEALVPCPAARQYIWWRVSQNGAVKIAHHGEQLRHRRFRRGIMKLASKIGK